MTPATNATHAHAQEFAVNDELHSHKALAQSSLLEVLYASCLCCSRPIRRSYQQQYCRLTHNQQSPHRASHPPPLGGGGSSHDLCSVDVTVGISWRMTCYVFGGKKVVMEYVLQNYSRISLQVLKNTMKNILWWLVSLPKIEGVNYWWL